uniref:Uncharacterized protein n=1 Tax=Anguilla anguilla TaxID=7936 RepID=A0A0E9VUW9_ANGAN
MSHYLLVSGKLKLAIKMGTFRR